MFTIYQHSTAEKVMYMYYLLGYKLLNTGKNEGLSDESRHIRSQNTFILALDGDIDFLPDAVLALVDSMKRNPLVAAACGRIHPVGSAGQFFLLS